MKFKDRESKYLPMLAKASVEAGLPAAYLVAIARMESTFDPDAKKLSGSDGARGGAYGLTQMTMKTAVALGYKGSAEGLLVPAFNIYWAVELTISNMKRIKVGDGETYSNVHLARDLAAMHNSGKRFDKAPRDAQDYAMKVLNFMEVYAPQCAQYAKQPAHS